MTAILSTLPALIVLTVIPRVAPYLTRERTAY